MFIQIRVFKNHFLRNEQSVPVLQRGQLTVFVANGKNFYLPPKTKEFLLEDHSDNNCDFLGTV